MEKGKNKKPKEQSEEMQAETAEIISEQSPSETIEKDVKENEDSYGKFKTKEALLNAYNELEAEFTKRCQLVKELEKELEELKDNGKNPPVPLYEREDWKSLLMNFRDKYPISDNFGKEVGEILSCDKELASNPNCLEIALLSVLIDNFKNPEELVNNENFLEEYVFNNEEVKNHVINEYLEKLEAERLPKTIGGGGEILMSPAKKPKSLYEAGRLAKNLFNNRRI